MSVYSGEFMWRQKWDRGKTHAHTHAQRQRQRDTESETKGDEKKYYSRRNRLKLHKYLSRSFNILKIILAAILNKVIMVCLSRGRFSPRSHGWSWATSKGTCLGLQSPETPGISMPGSLLSVQRSPVSVLVRWLELILYNFSSGYGSHAY